MDLDKHIDDTQMVLMFKSYEYIYENQDKTNISYLQQDMMIVNEFWDMVSLLETVLAHNKLEDHESLHNISFFTEQIYKELQFNFPEYGILDNEIENIHSGLDMYRWGHDGKTPDYDGDIIKIKEKLINRCSQF